MVGNSVLTPLGFFMWLGVPHNMAAPALSHGDCRTLRVGGPANKQKPHDVL